MPGWMITLPPEGAARQVGLNFVGAFGKLAPDVHVFDFKKYQEAYTHWLKDPDPDRVADLCNQHLLVQCLERRCRFLLVLSLCPVTLYTLMQTPKLGMINFHWFYEDYRIATYWKQVLPGYNSFLAAAPEPLEDPCREAGVALEFLPTAASGNFPLELSEKEYDVCFIGIPSAYRLKGLEKVAGLGLKLALGGSGWETYRGPLEKYLVTRNWLDTRETLEYYARSKVGLSLCYRDPREDPLGVQLSPRIYDILGAGAALVSDQPERLSAHRDEWSFRTYTTAGELREAVVAACKDYDIQESSQNTALQKNREAVLKNHTYAARAAHVLGLATRFPGPEIRPA